MHYVRKLEGTGVQPDIVVPVGIEFAGGRDIQKERAISEAAREDSAPTAGSRGSTATPPPLRPEISLSTHVNRQAARIERIDSRE